MERWWKETCVSPFEIPCNGEREAQRDESSLQEKRVGRDGGKVGKVLGDTVAGS